MSRVWIKLDVPADHHQELRVRAARAGKKSVREFLRDLVARAVAAPAPAAAPEKPARA